jgi:hypothetical protein
MALPHDYYAYKMTHDTGFAPCVRDSYLTLACCKPGIRKNAQRNSWVAGFAGASYGTGRLIYLMQVEEAPDFDSYFFDSRFKGRLDNIYGRVNGRYRQIATARHHTDRKDIEHDLSVDRVLVASSFVYFGKEKIKIPARFQKFVPRCRNYCCADGRQVDIFVTWIMALGIGIQGAPHNPLPPAPSALVQISSAAQFRD